MPVSSKFCIFIEFETLLFIGIVKVNFAMYASWPNWQIVSYCFDITVSTFGLSDCLFLCNFNLQQTWSILLVKTRLKKKVAKLQRYSEKSGNKSNIKWTCIHNIIDFNFIHSVFFKYFTFFFCYAPLIE